LIGEGAGTDVSGDDLAALYAPPSLPWQRVNMISTVDGAATGESGTSDSINNAPDKLVFDTLRARADAIVVGAGTARTEGYRPADRPIVVVSRRGEVPELLRGAPPGRVLLATCDSAAGRAEADEILGADHVLVLGEDDVDLARLRSELVGRGFRELLSEGGPHMLGDLLDSGVADELTATTVPRLVSGAGPRMVQGQPVDIPLRLALLLEHEGTLLGRWLIDRPRALGTARVTT